MMRLLRSIHAWIGILIMPWIILIGLTGLYLNHAKVINGVIYDSSFDEKRFDALLSEPAMDQNLARQIAEQVWGEEYQGDIAKGEYHKHAVFTLKANSAKLLVSRETGQYWIKTNFTRKTFDAGGQLRHTKIYWGRIFKRIHRDGWIGGGMGSWFADFAAGAMVIFGFSGMFLFLVPRIRRYKSRRT